MRSLFSTSRTCTCLALGQHCGRCSRILSCIPRVTNEVEFIRMGLLNQGETIRLITDGLSFLEKK